MCMWWCFVPLFENSELGLVDADCCGRLGSNGSEKLCARNGIAGLRQLGQFIQ